jgi:hypothetical protein
MSWVYIKSEPGLWTVGHYDPSEKWHPDSDHNNEDKAAARVHYLNGGGSKPMEAAFALLESDPHQWGNRPCPTCVTVTALIGKPFGCSAKR